MNESKLTQAFILDHLDDQGYDWLKHFTEKEIQQEGKEKFPKISGLRRLARTRGIVDMDVSVSLHTFFSNKYNCEVPIAQATVRINFKDGEVSAAAADAYIGNSLNYGHFMTSYAATRAEARAIRRAFGIETVAFEEQDAQSVDDAFGDAEAKISPFQKKHIQSTVKNRKLNLDNLIQEALGEQLDLEKLSNNQAKTLIRFINDGKK